jgi:DNA modification methylase
LRMYNILQGNCIEVLKTLPENSIDSIVTDPPYGLEFMGEEWDAPWKKSEVVEVTDKSTNGIFHDKGFSHGIRFSRGLVEMQEFQKWCESWAKEAFRVLKPGGYILAFGGSRTYHRLAGGIEDAGFEIRDQIMWVYGSGFPKSMNISLSMDKKGIDSSKWKGWGTALKPAHEPIVMARKPLEGTVVDNVLTWETGGINIDASRVPGEPVPINKLEEWSGFGQKIEPDYKQEMNTSGRFPANFIHDGSDEVVELFPNAKGGAYPAVRGKSDIGAFAQGGTHKDKPNQARVMGDEGSAARFFYCAKANSKDRNEGLENHKNGQRDLFSGDDNTHTDNPVSNEDKRKNTHPTVKPTELMRYLIKMVTPAGGTVLDPFTGSGSTGKAAMLDGYKFVGIEMNEEYVAIAKARIEHAILKK